MNIKNVRVYLVGRSGNRALVQWVDLEGMPQRAVIEEAELNNGYVSADILNEAPSAALDFSRMSEVVISPEKIQKMLRENGVFDESDFKTRKLINATAALGRAIMREVNNFINSEVSND